MFHNRGPTTELTRVIYTWQRYFSRQHHHYESEQMSHLTEDAYRRQRTACYSACTTVTVMKDRVIGRTVEIGARFKHELKKLLVTAHSLTKKLQR